MCRYVLENRETQSRIVVREVAKRPIGESGGKGGSKWYIAFAIAGTKLNYVPE